MRVYDILPLFKGDLDKVQLVDINNQFNVITLNKAIKVFGAKFLNQITAEQINYDVDYSCNECNLVIICTGLPDKLYNY